VRAAVELANAPSVWTDALRRGDPSLLAAAWTGDALAYFSQEILDYRARGLRLVSTPLSLDVLEVQLVDATHATARTREQWEDWVCTEDGEPRGTRAPHVEDAYTLVRTPEGWRVRGVEVVLLTGSFDWAPIPEALATPTPCAAVLDSEW